MEKKALIIAAHADDIEIGSIALISKLQNEGYKIYSAVLSKGDSDELKSAKRIEVYQHNMKQLKIKDITPPTIMEIDTAFYQFKHSIKQQITSLIDQINPDIIITNSPDNHEDHRITYELVSEVARPLSNNNFQELYCFEIPGSSHRNIPSDFFNYNLFLNAGDGGDYDLKGKLLLNYNKIGVLRRDNSGGQDGFDMRSIEFILESNIYNGKRVSTTEPIERYRYVKYR